MHGKKFHFYVNKCGSCQDTTDISFRPHKPRLCNRCSKIYLEMKAKNGKAPKTVDFTDQPLTFPPYQPESNIIPVPGDTDLDLDVEQL